jgi:ribosomal protein S27AE
MDVNQTVDQINQTNLAIALTVIFVPLLFIVAVTFAAVMQKRSHRCPRCGNWRKGNKVAIQTIKNDNKTTTKRIIVCGKCGNEYSA